jgi:hypothetical protein
MRCSGVHDGEIPVKEKLFKELFELVRYLAKIEATTTAGRVNILGMLFSLILTLGLSLPALLETIIRLIHPNAKVGTSLVQLLVAFSVFVLLCAGMLAYLEGPRDRRIQETIEDSRENAPDAPAGGGQAGTGECSRDGAESRLGP